MLNKNKTFSLNNKSVIIILNGKIGYSPDPIISIYMHYYFFIIADNTAMDDLSLDKCNWKIAGL